jgi:hypothetical protein
MLLLFAAFARACGVLLVCAVRSSCMSAAFVLHGGLRTPSTLAARLRVHLLGTRPLVEYRRCAPLCCDGQAGVV